MIKYYLGGIPEKIKKRYKRDKNFREQVIEAQIEITKTTVKYMKERRKKIAKIRKEEKG